jgi:hypothetical protein
VQRWYSVLLANTTLTLLGIPFFSTKTTAWLGEHRVWLAGSVGVVAALLALLVQASRFKVFATVVLALALIRIYGAGSVNTVRSFFRVHKIAMTPGGYYHVLMHGTTMHGLQRYHNDDGSPTTGRPEPIAYYHLEAASGRRSAPSASARRRHSTSR